MLTDLLEGGSQLAVFDISLEFCRPVRYELSISTKAGSGEEDLFMRRSRGRNRGMGNGRSRSRARTRTIFFVLLSFIVKNLCTLACTGTSYHWH